MTDQAELPEDPDWDDLLAFIGDPAGQFSVLVQLSEEGQALLGEQRPGMNTQSGPDRLFGKDETADPPEW